ncbi:MAG: amino acid adenylation domain-containing protein, partial [Candidatus Latescibacteria bacterium]|nr:amino acid adenylation domain-containing protein [Candidatus Latescibacterota bacterium]
MLYRQLASGNSGAYIMQSRLWVNGILDKPDFQKAWSMIVDRHEALRTLFVTEGTDRPLQIVLKHLNIEIPLCDLSKNSESDRNAKIDQYCKEELASGFDLKSPPLFRLKLFRYSTAQHLFVMTFHHIIMDGWCQGILHDELLECYHAIRNRRRPNLAAVPSFSGYVRYLSGLNTDEGLSYWKSALEGYEPGRETSWMKRTQLTEGQFDLNRETFTLSGERLNRLRSMAAELGITLNTVFQTLWGTVISRLSGKRDIVWGTVVSGRPPELPGSDRIIGLFINTVPVRFQLDLTVTFREALNSMGEFLRKSMQHQHMPLAEVQSFSGARGNLFDHLLIFENYPAEMIENRGDDNLTIVPESPLSGHTDYDLVCVVDADENLECLLKYNATVIEDENVKLIRDSLLKLTDTVLDNPDSPLAMIQLLPKKILDTVLYRLPIGKTLDQCTMTFPELFAAQVAETPERPAVEAVDGNFSYRDLDKVSDTISHDLIEKAGIQPGDTVAVMTGRNRTMIPSIIGIMKASAVFVPLDPGYPDERIRFILEDCGCSVVIADSKSLTRLKRYDFITVIDAEEVITRQMSVKTPKKWPEPDDVAYIIYTSGSTGKPKGVMIEHRQLSNFIQGYTNSVLDKHDNPLRIAFIANYVFDASGRAFYPSLCRGDTVCVVDEETRLDGFALTRFIKTDHIDLLDGTPSLCSLIVDCGTRCDTLKRVVLGGEALRHTLVDRIDKVFPNAALTNVYGPTETTIDSTFFYVGSSNNENLDIAPIGRPLPNQQVYVLDDALNPLPVGAIGEICIGGVGVGRGYLNRKDLTRMSFVPNPFSSGDKLYRTGDLGCWRNDENLLFLGRRDFQIKVRGFRIETGEIEVAISSVPQISECAVVLRTDADSNNTLCAYYVGDSDPQELRDNIKRILPSHMIPDMFFQIDQMPFTPSGKIDRITLSRLIEKGLDNIPRKQVHVTATGQQIIEAMGKVLNRDN